MTITKYGQSCLLIEEQDLRIIMDPGSFSTAQNELQNIDVILITHDHGDHFTLDSVKAILSNNPNAKIYTTETVKDILEKEGVSATVLTHGETVIEKGLKIEGVGELHALLMSQMPQSQNVGFFIADKFFYPGDALTLPGRPVEILALPAAAPWSKLSETIDYTVAVKPAVTFPVHDSILAHPTMMQGPMMKIFAEKGVTFKPVELNTAYEF